MTKQRQQIFENVKDSKRRQGNTTTNHSQHHRHHHRQYSNTTMTRVLLVFAASGAFLLPFRTLEVSASFVPPSTRSIISTTTMLSSTSSSPLPTVGSDNDQNKKNRGLIESYNSKNNGRRKNRNNEKPVISPSTSVTSSSSSSKPITSERDRLIARAAKLRQSLVKQQAELVELERQIACCSSSSSNDDDNENLSLQLRRLFMDTTVDDGYYGVFGYGRDDDNNNDSRNGGGQQQQRGLLPSMQGIVGTTMDKFTSSSLVLKRKLDRVKDRRGPKNQRWKSVQQYIIHELEAGIRIVQGLVSKPEQISYLVDPQTPTLVPHVPAILARLDKLEVHVSPILERVLNNRQHLASIEPYLDEILERFDDIEPHVPWILENIDALAPYTGLLLKHIDALLLYADVDDIEKPNNNIHTNDEGDEDDSYSLANQLLPHLEDYISKLDVVGPHLVYLRPHVPLLLKHDRIARVSPHIDKLFARGYNNLGASANLDILLFWFGWSLRIPGLPKMFFAFPFSPRLVTFLANRLPKKFARRGKQYCRNMECSIDSDYGISWNKLESKSASSR